MRYCWDKPWRASGPRKVLSVTVTVAEGKAGSLGGWEWQVCRPLGLGVSAPIFPSQFCCTQWPGPWLLVPKLMAFERKERVVGLVQSHPRSRVSDLPC